MKIWFPSEYLYALILGLLLLDHHRLFLHLQAKLQQHSLVTALTPVYMQKEFSITLPTSPSLLIHTIRANLSPTLLSGCTAGLPYAIIASKSARTPLHLCSFRSSHNSQPFSQPDPWWIAAEPHRVQQDLVLAIAQALLLPAGRRFRVHDVNLRLGHVGNRAGRLDAAWG